MNHTYTPLPGTIPAKAVAALALLAPGAELSTAELCEAIGQPTTGGFGKCIALSLNAGLVKFRKDGRLLYWSLGDGVQRQAAVQDVDEPEDVPPPAPTTAAALMSAWRPARSVFDLGGASSEEAKQEVEQLPQEAEPIVYTSAQPDEAQQAAYLAAIGTDEKSQPLAFALWSDGRLQIQRGDTELALLGLDETRALLRYLDRVTEAEDRT